MYAITKRTVVEVDIELNSDDIELYEKDHMAFGKQIQKILEAEKGTKLTAFGYKKPEIRKYDNWAFGSVTAYWWGKDREVKQGN